MLAIRLWLLACALGALLTAVWGAGGKPTPPPPNAYDFYVKAGNAVVGMNPPPEMKLEDTSGPVVSAKSTLVAKNANALSLLRKGFAYTFRLPNTMSLKPDMAFAMHGMQLTMLLVYEGQVKAAFGDAQGAADSYLDAMRFGMDIQHTAHLDGFMLGIMCQGMGRSMLWKTLDSLDETQTTAVLQRVQRMAGARTTYAQALESDKVYFQQAIDFLIAHPEKLARLGGETAGHTEQEYAMFGGMTTPMLRELRGIFTTWMNNVLAVAKGPFSQEIEYPGPQGKNEQFVTALKAMGQSLRFGHFLATETENQHALLVVTLALRAYHNVHGAYPETLDALAPTFVAKVPGDPYNHLAPYCYKRTEGKFLLYSIGPNGTDDHGSPAAKATGNDNFADPDSAGDIVVGVNSY